MSLVGQRLSSRHPVNPEYQMPEDNDPLVTPRSSGRTPSPRKMSDAALLAELAVADVAYDRMVELLAEFDRRRLVTARP